MWKIMDNSECEQRHPQASWISISSMNKRGGSNSEAILVCGEMIRVCRALLPLGFNRGNHSHSKCCQERSNLLFYSTLSLIWSRYCRGELLLKKKTFSSEIWGWCSLSSCDRLSTHLYDKSQKENHRKWTILSSNTSTYRAITQQMICVVLLTLKPCGFARCKAITTQAANVVTISV